VPPSMHVISSPFPELCSAQNGGTFFHITQTGDASAVDTLYAEYRDHASLEIREQVTAKRGEIALSRQNGHFQDHECSDFHNQVVQCADHLGPKIGPGGRHFLWRRITERKKRRKIQWTSLS